MSYGNEKPDHVASDIGELERPVIPKDIATIRSNIGPVKSAEKELRTLLEKEKEERD